MNSKFNELLDWANHNYDLIIIDTPPILAVTDAAIMAIMRDNNANCKI